jgi:hypothetical protein
MPARPHLNEDDTCGIGSGAAIKNDILQRRLAKYLTKDLRAISRYMRIHDDLVDSNSGYAR